LSGSVLKVPGGGGGGVVASYPLLSQAPTPVEVELVCDNKTMKFYQKMTPNIVNIMLHSFSKRKHRNKKVNKVGLSCAKVRSRQNIIYNESTYSENNKLNQGILIFFLHILI
jgi:hypothetical protein